MTIEELHYLMMRLKALTTEDLQRMGRVVTEELERRDKDWKHPPIFDPKDGWHEAKDYQKD